MKGLESVKHIRSFAVMAHEGQQYGGLPYEVHLDAVVGVLLRFGVYGWDTLAAGYLHDVLEDTELTLKELVPTVGESVAVLVDACTDGEGENRKARKERPYRLIPKHPDARKVKLADRIANIEASLAQHFRHNNSLTEMYRKEQAEFRRRLTEKLPLVKGGRDEAMLNYIEHLLETS